MAEKTVKKTTTKKKGKGLTQKVGPLPLYVYLIGVAIVVIYLYYRHKNSQGTNPNSQFNGSLGQQTIPSGVVIPSSTTGDTTSDTTGNTNTYPTDYATETDLASAIDSVNNNTAAAIAGITFPVPNVNITVPTTGNGSPSKTTAASKTAAKTAAPFGGVKRTTTGKNGALITYYNSGRITEKLPGKTAYVVHK